MAKYSKTANIILHSIFLLIGISLSTKTLQSSTLLYIFIAYTLTYMTYTVVYDLSHIAFPRLMGALVVLSYLFYLYLTNTEIEGLRDLSNTLLILSTIFTVFFLVSSILSTNVKLRCKKFPIYCFTEYNLLYYSIYAVSTFSIIFFLLTVFRIIDINILLSVAIIFAIYPHFNLAIIKLFRIKFISFSESLGIKINLDRFESIPNIKSFILNEDNFFGSNKFFISDAIYNTSETLIFIQQLSLQLSKDWKPIYADLFVKDQITNNEIKYKIVSKNNDGITAIDENATMYNFGNYSYVKDKIKRSDKANLFLLKNDLLIAKFILDVKIDSDKINIIKNLKKTGDTILFFKGSHTDLYNSYNDLFDKIYYRSTEKKQKYITLEINSENQVAIFSIKKSFGNNEYAFTIGSNTKDKIEIQNKDDLYNLTDLIDSANKIKSLTKTIIITSISINIFCILLANFIYTPSIILLISLTTGLISEFVISRIINNKIEINKDASTV